MLVGPSIGWIGWLYIASKRVTVATRVRTRSNSLYRLLVVSWIISLSGPLTDKWRGPRVGYGLPASGI